MNSFDLEKDLPASIEAERVILGSVLIENTLMSEASVLTLDDFSLDSHRRIWSQLQRMHEAGESLNTIAVVIELQKDNAVASVGGVAYVSELEVGIPRRPSIAQYTRIVREKARLRRIIHLSNAAASRAMDQRENAAQIATDFEAELLSIAVDERSGIGSNLFISGMEFLSQSAPEIDWMVEGVIQRGSNGFFAAQPKGGKSWAAADLALSLAMGCPWLGFRVPRPVKVAVISREDNPGLTQWRMKRLLQKKYKAATLGLVDENLLVNTRAQSRELMLDNAGQMAELLQALRKHKPEFAIFDVFNCLHGADENSNEEMRRVLRQLSRIQTEIGCGIAVIHHYSKAEAGSLTQKLRGSGAIAGWCEWLIGISMVDEEQKIRKMEFELKASAPPDPVHYRMESNDPEGWAKLDVCPSAEFPNRRKSQSPAELMQ